MGRRGKAKFGVYTGKTLRNWPSRKKFGYYFNACGVPNSCQQFAVVKEVLHADRDEFCKAKFDLDDGIPFNTHRPFPNVRRGYPSDPVIHSLNKHKRWLLPELVKNRVESIYEEGIEETTDVAKRRRGDSADKLRVTVVERQASACVPRHLADCVGFSSTHTSSPSSPVKKLTKSRAHVGDLRPKSASGNEPELYYEFLSPFPDKTWPVHRQLDSGGVMYDVVGTKSLNKCKGRRNKHYRHGIPLDEPVTVNSEIIHSEFLDEDDDVYQKNSSNNFNKEFLFPLGTLIRNVIESKVVAGKKNDHLHVKSSLPKSAGHSQFGKGDAVFLDIGEQNLCFESLPCEEDGKLNEQEQITADRKVKVRMLAQTICPDNLKEDFGDDYHEALSFPRKFIIKTDLNKIMPKIFRSPVDCSLLFEVPDSSCCSEAEFVDVYVALSVPKTELITEKVVQGAESELCSFSLNLGLTTIKDLVGHVTDSIVQIVQDCSSEHEKSYKKNALNADHHPIKFIHGLCEQKPEVCGLKSAARFSVTYSKEKEAVADNVPGVGNDSMLGTPSDCDICLTSGETSLDCKSGMRSFTRLLECSHEFCNVCWRLYIASCIRSGQARISCPHFNCSTLVGEALVWSSTNSELYQMFCKVRAQLAIDTNPELRSCPAPDCVHLAYVPSCRMQISDALPVICHCGDVWCFSCQKDGHWPASCEEAEAFRKQIHNDEELKNVIRREGRISSVNVKRCPFCSYPIDKGTGCQHMSCRCGKEFCWECLRPWEDHDWDKCLERRKDLEKVELVVDVGNARYRKYGKLSLSNLRARSRGNVSVVRKLVEQAKRVENSHRLVSDTLDCPSSRLVRSFVENSISSHVETIFYFKYLAHFILENTAAAMAVSRRKKMTGYLDSKIRMLEFIIDRMDEVLVKPIALTDVKKLEHTKTLLRKGEGLMKGICALVRANRGE